MTTVAYRDGILAADSQVTCGNILSATQKLYVLPDCIIAGAGHLTAVLEFVDWMRRGRPAKSRPNFTNRTLSALVVWPDRVEEWDDALVPMLIHEQFAAIGSGKELALGAMAMGASATQAVEVAAAWDINTGGEIVSHNVAALLPSKRRRAPVRRQRPKRK